MAVDKEVIESLLNELRKYEAAGNEDNVRAVKNELSRLGYKAAAPSKRAEKASPRKEER
jgi:hypothetical protein